MIAVVKADAYGHGAITVVRALRAEGCERFAVARLDELAALREAGIDADVLLLGGMASDAEAEAAVAFDAIAVLQDAAEIARFDRAARRRDRQMRVHLEIDTGMRRMGAAPAAAPALVAAIRASSNLALAGIATHLARADEPSAPEADRQLAALRAVLAACAPLPRDLLVHAANSAGLLGGAAGDFLPEANAVRPGLALYGVSPFSGPIAGESPPSASDLSPVMSLIARVVALRRVSAGEGVGYGATWRAPRETMIATVAAGYADGVPWSLGNRGSLWLAGAARPIVGRISMDYLTLDVGEGRDVALGDPALVFGALDGARIDLVRVAQAAETIPYELLVRVGPRVPRRFVDSPAAG